MLLIERIRKNQIDGPLATLQLLSFILVVALVMDAVLLYRHFTDDALTPALDYLLSLKLAFPPVVVVGATYLYAFLTGESASAAPKSVWDYIRNNTLQSRAQLFVFLLFAVLVSLGTASVLRYHTPPAYEKLVAKLLGGANDDNHVINDAIARMKSNAPALSDRLAVIAKVFEERRLLNNENKIPSTFLPRTFIRQLDADADGSWKDHPLRRFALAEANSMLAQALASLQSKSAGNAIEIARNSAVENYAFVVADRSNLSTELMKQSAAQNIGNVYLYAGDCEAANSIYSKLSLPQLNAGTEGNRVAALASCGKSGEAAAVGSDAIERLQGKPEVLKGMRDFVSLLTNTGFVKLINGTYEEGLEDMQAAHDLIPDQMAKQNLALALIGVSKPREAIAILEADSDAPPVSSENQLYVVIRSGGGSCTYLIRALALATAGDTEQAIFANVLTYARRPQPPDVIVRESGMWKETARGVLQMDRRPCGNLMLLPFVAHTLERGGAGSGAASAPLSQVSP